MPHVAESMALEWLQTQGYKMSEIKKRSNATPDFICSDGKRFEAKYLYSHKVFFTDRQVKSLRNDDIILVFHKTGFVTSFLWKNRNKTFIKVVIQKLSKKVKTCISVDTEVWKELQRRKEIGLRDSFNKILRRLLNLDENSGN